MKKIGLIADRKSKKLFLLPEQVKELSDRNIEIYVPAGYGKCLGIADEQYLSNNAKVLKNNAEVIAKADIILKVNAFAKSEIALATGKIMVTMVNYVVNADMILNMLKNNVTGLAWNCLAENNKYLFFSEFEKIKGRHCVNSLIWAWANKGLGIINAKTISGRRPRVLILNAQWAAFEAVRACLANNIDVTLLDSDTEYLNDLKQSNEIKTLTETFGTKFEIDDAKFETLLKCFKTHDGFINTCIDPISKTKVRITKEMAAQMPAGSVLIDAACENGYGFAFQKAYADDKIDFKEMDNVVYSCVADITDIYPKAVSQIISKKSVEYLAALAEKGIDGKPALSNIIVVENGKVINDSVRTQLRLY